MPRKIKKKFPSILILILVLVIGFLIYVLNTRTRTLIYTPSYHYQFAYALDDGKVRIFDLNTQNTNEVPVGSEKIEQLDWSKKGKLAVKDSQGDLFLVEGSNSKKLQGNLEGYFLWKQGQNGEKLIVTNQNQDTPDYKIKAYEVKTDGPPVLLTLDQYHQILSEGYNPPKLSFNLKYKVGWVQTKDGSRRQISSLEDNKQVLLPEGIGRPIIAPDASYLIAQASLDPNNQSIYDAAIYKMKDVMGEKFDHPVWNNTDINSYQWLGDNKLVYLSHKNQVSNDSVALAYDYTFNLLDLSNGQSKNIYSIPGINPAELDEAFYVNDRGTQISFITRKKDTSENGNLLIVDIETGQVINETPFKIGVWFPDFYD